MKVSMCSLILLVMTCGVTSAADDLQTASDNLRAAMEGKKTPAEIKRLSVLVLLEAKKQMGPAPADADKANWDAQVKYAEQVSEYAEYALYSASIGAPSATAIDMISTLEADAPKSKYLTQDTYLVAADAALTAQEGDLASAFAKKALVAPKGAKPEQASGTAHYIVGVVAANKKDNATADKELRAALPGIKGMAALEGPALYFLGEADYSLGRQGMDRALADEGIKYLQQSALIPGQYQAGAGVEVKRMKTELKEK